MDFKKIIKNFFDIKSTGKTKYVYIGKFRIPYSLMITMSMLGLMLLIMIIGLIGELGRTSKAMKDPEYAQKLIDTYGIENLGDLGEHLTTEEPTTEEIVTEEPTTEEPTTEAPKYDFTDEIDIPDVVHPYYVKVNRQACVVTVYTLDENNEFTVPVKAILCSCGVEGHETPTGVFVTADKYEWLPLVNDVYGQYSYRFNNDIFFHSVPYFSPSKDALEAEEFNKLGGPASRGCVRMAVQDAKWIYDNIPFGSTVEVYDSEDPGPLGKPGNIVHDTTSPNAGWDPTDPDPANPWLSADESI